MCHEVAAACVRPLWRAWTQQDGERVETTRVPRCRRICVCPWSTERQGEGVETTRVQARAGVSRVTSRRKQSYAASNSEELEAASYLKKTIVWGRFAPPGRARHGAKNRPFTARAEGQKNPATRCGGNPSASKARRRRARQGPREQAQRGPRNEAQQRPAGEARHKLEGPPQTKGGVAAYWVLEGELIRDGAAPPRQARPIPAGGLHTVCSGSIE